MTKAELIKLMELYPDDMEVRICEEYCGDVELMSVTLEDPDNKPFIFLSFSDD